MKKTRRIKNKHIENFIMFWRMFLKFKSGVFGLTILIFFILLAAFGSFIAEPHPSLYTGTHPPLAAPEWAGIFDPDYFPDQYLVNNDFQTATTLEDLQISITTNGSLSASYQWVNEEDTPSKPGVLAIKISDNTTQQNATGSYAIISLKFSFTWEHDRPPNTAEFSVIGKGIAEGIGVVIANFLSSPAYSIDWKAYIGLKDHNLTQLLDYLEENGVQLTYGFTYDDHGVFFSPNSRTVGVSSDWKTSSYKMRDDVKVALFKKGNVLEFEIVLAMLVEQDDLRVDGTFVWYVDLVQVVGTSYYYGLMGTTDSGADLWSLIVDGAKISLMVGFIVATVQIIIGTLVGVVSGYYGGRVDEVLMRIVDFFMSIPALPLLIVLTFIFTKMNMSKATAVILALIIFGWTGPTRITRSQVLVEREKPYVEAARAAGASNAQIIVRHMIPAVMPLVLIYMIFGVTGAIISEAALSFIGLGPDWNSWGRILQRASIGSLQAGGRTGYGLSAWWYIFFPGLMLSLLGLAFMFLGFALERVFNPRASTF